MFSVTEKEIIRFYLRRNRKELSKIDLVDVRLTSFFITCSKKQKRNTLTFWTGIWEKPKPNWQKCLCVHLWEVALRGCSSARSCPHTPSPSKCRPSRSVTPCGRKPVTVFHFKWEISFFFPVLRLYTHQTTVPSPEPKSRRDWGAKEGSLFFICDNDGKKSKTYI